VPSTAGAIDHRATPIQSDGDDAVINFETWSNRLLPGETKKLDRLAESLRDQPEKRLLIVIPSQNGPAGRHFFSSRVAVVERELSSRGVLSQKAMSPCAAGIDCPIVLRIVSPTLPLTPIEIVATPGNTDGLLAEAADPANESGTGTPLSILPKDNTDPSAAGSAETEKSTGTPEGGSPLSAVLARAEPKPAVAQSVAVDELWIAATGRLLRDVLKEWGDRAGWTVVWTSDREYPIEASATFSGDFTKAASQLFEGFSTVAPAPSAHFYKGNRVLLVESGEGR
jgi:hypothetical protein